VTRYLAKRLLELVPTLFCVAAVVFFLVRLAPGGPFDTERAVPPEVLKALNARYRLDQPVWVQFGDFWRDLVWHGDLGPSTKYPGHSVNEIIATSLPVSLELASLAMAFALALGVPVGVLGAVRKHGWADRLGMLVALVGISIPRFVLAPLCIMLFALTLYWLPVGRWETWRHAVLPVVCAGLPTAAYVARLTRGGMLEVLDSDFVRTARAKGLAERTVVLRHALRGGLMPLVSYLGPGFSALIVGQVVVEKIFSVPGMGTYFIDAAVNRDHGLVVGLTLVYGAMLMILNAAVDVAYAWLDPRVRLE
jgi:oligopeptide transport system permease protein